MRFPFSDSPDTAVITCCHVLEAHKPILYVSHDADGMWQFLCGGAHKSSDARCISLEEAVKCDQSVGRLKDLPCGHCAIRKSGIGRWKVCRR